VSKKSNKSGASDLDLEISILGHELAREDRLLNRRRAFSGIRNPDKETEAPFVQSSNRKRLTTLVFRKRLCPYLPFRAGFDLLQFIV
jgi:hypothetical protein